MSNFTDGKNYLAAGDFTSAAGKLEKALDAHPADGRIWWALMLCKAECKTEAELEKKLIREYTAAAESNGKPPENPVNGAYGKNALRYAPSDKYQSFATALNVKLGEIWQSYGGKPLKTGREIKREQVRSSKRGGANKSTSGGTTVIAFYAIVAAATVCGVLASVGIGVASKGLLWTGFALFAALLIVAAGFIVATNRAGKKIRGGTVTALAAGFVMEIIMSAVALSKADGAALIASIVMLVLTAGVTAFVLLPMQKKGEQNENDEPAKKNMRITEKAKKRLDNYNDSDD